MLANPDWFPHPNPARRALVGRPARVNLDDVTPVLVAVVFEDDEVAPPDLCLVPRVLRGFEHSSHGEVFQENSIVFGGVKPREFVLEIALPVRHPGVNLCHPLALGLPVVRLVVFAGERAVLAVEAVAVVGEVEATHGASVRIVDEVHHAEVDANGVIRVDGLDGGFVGVVSVDAERDLPRAGRLFLERDLFDLLVVWQVSVEATRNLAGFAFEFLEK